MTTPEHPLLQFFTYEHLPPNLREVSKPFCELAHAIAATSPEAFEVVARGLIREQLGAWNEWPIANNVEAQMAAIKLDEAHRRAWNHARALEGMLRLVLEAKDCAVRAVLFKEPAP